MKWLLAFVVIGLLSGCESFDGVLIPEQALSLNEIREAILSESGGRVRVVSENGRELYSPYFSRKQGDTKFDPNTSPERLWAHFWILGDRRPYDVRVQVISEKRQGGVYEAQGEDTVLSEKVAKELEQKLHESPDKRNAIDDFRPY